MFALPVRGNSESDGDYEGRCYQNDLDGLMFLVNKVASAAILPGDEKYFTPFRSQMPYVIGRFKELLERNDFHAPGPFKRAAVLTIAILDHPILLYKSKSADPILQWKLSVFIAARITQLYIVKAFSSKDIKIKPPQMPSLHFKRDFLYCIMMLGQRDSLLPLALIWELLTYAQNDDLKGTIDDECRKHPDPIPGIDLSCSDIIGSGWDDDIADEEDKPTKQKP